MNRLMMIISLLILCSTAFAQSEDWLWTRQAGGTDYDYGQSIAIDNNGNCYVTGFFMGNASFGSTTLINNGGFNIYIAKIDIDGNYLWATQAQVTGAVNGYSIASDSVGNSYVTGYFFGTAVFGSISLTSSNSADIFISKLDTNGNYLWAKKAGSANGDYGNGITTDSIGNSYVTGSIQGTSSFGSTNLTSNGNADIFITKLNSNGNFLWANNAGGSGDDNGYSLATDSSGNIYVIGSFHGIANFGSTILTSNGDADIFITKLNSNGNFIWAQKAGGMSSDHGYGIATDSNGSCYITGRFSENASFGSLELTSSGDYDIFIAKLDTSGNFNWAMKAGGGSYDKGNGIAVDSFGNSYVTGYFMLNASFGSTNLNGSGSYDIFVSKLDTNGDFLWAKKAGGTSEDISNSIAVDSTGDSYVTGYFKGNPSFGVKSLTCMGFNDVFVSKLGSIHDLLSPYGGEVWQSGYTKTVYWDFLYAGSEVNISLSINNGASWIMLNSIPVQASLGRFSFTVPMVNSSQCLIKVESTSNSNAYDVSDSTFSISTSSNPTILLTAPNIAKLHAGMSYSVNWQVTGVSNINLEYSIDAGANWISIDSSIPANSGTYSWTVPHTPSQSCYLRLSDAANPTVYDWSDNPCIIYILDVVSPNGEEIWGIGSQHNITWNSANVSDVCLEYSIDDGDTWTQIVLSMSSVYGMYNWTIPVVYSAQCRVRISDITDNSLCDISDGVFNIRPQLIVNSPNGSESLLVNSIYGILWNNTADVSFVLMDYSVDNGNTWLPIQTSAYPASVGRYDWIVPNNPSENCLVKVRRSDDSSIYDVSDAVFTITVNAQPILEIGDNSFEFGIVYLGSSSGMRDLWLSNTGNAAMEVSALSFWQTNSVFEVVGATLPITIPQGDSVALQIRFTPQVAGAVTDSLYIYNNSQNLPVAAIWLSGMGEYVPPKPPDGVQIVINGESAVISWEAVTETIFNTPLVPDYYLVFYNGSADVDGQYYYLGRSWALSYLHDGVAVHADNMFYRVVAYKFYGRGRPDFDSLGIETGMPEREVLTKLRGAGL